MDDKREADRRLSMAAEKMRDAQGALDAAEAEWFAAIEECDRLDGIVYPTVAEMRGILKLDK